MSFIQSETRIGYKPGYFLADAEDCTRLTAEISQNHAAVVTSNGKKYVPGGSVIPSNDSNAVGILYEDVDVTTGNMPGSIVTRGLIYGDRLPAALDSDAATALTGIKTIATSPAIKRPTSFNKGELATITVTSAEGSGSGKTDVSVTGYTLKAGEGYVYKIHATVAPACSYGEVLPVGDGEWTAAAFPLDELASTDGYKIGVAAVDTTGAAVAYGSATIDVK